MKKKFIKHALIAAITASCIGVTIFGVLDSTKSVNDVSGAQSLEDIEKCENWYYSGKGFAFDFSFEIPLEAKQNRIILCTSSWKRVASYLYLNFDTEGNVTTNIGYLVRHSDYWTLVAMYNQFGINKDCDGTETISIFSVDQVNVTLDMQRFHTINYNMCVDEDAYIKDDWYSDVHGLMFKAFIPTYNSTSTYGIAIVPNEYLFDNTTDYLEYLDEEGISYSKSYCAPIQLKSTDESYAKFGAGYTIQATLKVKEKHYLRDFSAVAFEEFAGGTHKYAFNVNEERANLYNIAYKELKKGGLSSKATTYASGIINNIESRTPCLSSSHLNAYPANNIDQIMKNANYSSVDNSVAIKAAKGESESAQLVLRTSLVYEEYTYFAGVSNLKNGNNIIENSNIEISHELYQNVKTNWSETESHYSALDQLYPYGYETLVTGYYPDVLLPMHVAVRSWQNKIKGYYGANQALFIKVKVPDEVASGTYVGNIIIYVKEEGYITVPLSVNVENFSLEGRKNQKSVFEISRSELFDFYGSRAKYNSLKNPFYVGAWNMLAERGVCGGVVPYYLDTTENLPEYVEAVKKYVKESKSNVYLIDYLSLDVEMKWTYKSSDSDTKVIDMTGGNKQSIILSDDYSKKPGLKSILKALVMASTDAENLLEGACIFDSGADEPNSPEEYLRSILNYNSLQKSIDYVETECATRLADNPKVLKALQDITLIVTCGPENGKFAGTYSYANLDSISNVSATASYCSCGTASVITYRNLGKYCPNVMWNCDNTTHSGSGYGWSTLSKIYDGTDTTTKVWEYTCCQPVSPYPSYIINSPMIRTRANRWRHFSLGIQGEFYYMANRTSQHESYPVKLTEQDIIDGKATFQQSYGDGLLIYACHDLLGYADRNLYWLSSLRLENIAEAGDDLNYMYYAKELAGSDDTKLTLLNNIVNSVYEDKLKPFSMTTSSDNLISARNDLITFINGLVS